MEKQKATRTVLLSLGLLVAGWFLFHAPAAFALDTAGVYAPKVGGNVLDQPMLVAGIAPVNSTVFVFVDGKLLGATKTVKPKTKKATTAAFSFTYKKRIGVGNHTLQTQVVRGKEKSDWTRQTFIVPKNWPRKLDGMMVATQYWNQLPYGIMIENTPAARPQAGMSQASVVYETLAEGGVTRFLAIFPQAVRPKSVGPVRSSRPYYVDWAKEYDAIYMHAGGSRDALNEIGALKVRSFDGLTRKGAPYVTRKCYGVHCLFTDASRLLKLVQNNKLTNVNAISTGSLFKSDFTFAQRPNHKKTISIDFNGRTYRVDWTYDRKTNRYYRKNGGVVAKDRNTGKQINAANILVQRVPKEKVLDRKGRISLKLTGKGDATLFRDGQSIAMRWEKKNASAKTRFFVKSSGKEVEFNRGATWIEVVPGTRKVTYK
ncbi:MAG: DUF3048 domain-containing protein [Patescibacteria group bacterium]|jgi:hypothetical protein